MTEKNITIKHRRRIESVEIILDPLDDTKVRDVEVKYFEEYIISDPDPAIPDDVVRARRPRKRPSARWVSDLKAAYEKLRA